MSEKTFETTVSLETGDAVLAGVPLGLRYVAALHCAMSWGFADGDVPEGTELSMEVGGAMRAIEWDASADCYVWGEELPADHDGPLCSVSDDWIYPAGGPRKFFFFPLEDVRNYEVTERGAAARRVVWCVVYADTGAEVPDVFEVNLEEGYVWQHVRGPDGQLEKDGARNLRCRRLRGEFRVEGEFKAEDFDFVPLGRYVDAQAGAGGRARRALCGPADR